MDYDDYDTRERKGAGLEGGGGDRKGGFLHVSGLILYFLVGSRWAGFGGWGIKDDGIRHKHLI